MDLYEKAAQGQLEAYNNHDIEEFLTWYTEDVQALDIDTGAVLLSGKDTMRLRYSKVFANKFLYCKLLNRMVLNRTIIDHEEITFDESDNRKYAIAIYDVNEDGLISTIRFTKGKA